MIRQLFVAAVGLSANVAAAQTTAEVIIVAPEEPKRVTLLGIRSGTVAPNGMAFVSLSGTTRPDGADYDREDLDSAAAVGFGFGNASDGVGIQLTAVVTPLNEAFAESGYLSFKASRRLGGDNSRVFAALSFDNLGAWGDSSELDESVALAVTWFTETMIADTSYPLMMTGGVGSDVRDDRTDAGVFFGAGIGLSPNLGTSLAWTGETVTLGFAFTFDGLENIAFTASVNDLFNKEDRQQIALSASWFITDLFGG